MTGNFSWRNHCKPHIPSFCSTHKRQSKPTYLPILLPTIHHHASFVAHGAVFLLISPSRNLWRFWKQADSEFKSQLQHFVLGSSLISLGLHFPISAIMLTTASASGGVMSNMHKASCLFQDLLINTCSPHLNLWVFARLTKALSITLHTYAGTHHKCVTSSKKEIVLKIWKPK